MKLLNLQEVLPSALGRHSPISLSLMTYIIKHWAICFLLFTNILYYSEVFIQSLKLY